MAEHARLHHQVQVHPQSTGASHTRLGQSTGSPSTSQVVAVATLLPIGGTLLGLAGLTLVGTLIGTAVAAPLALLLSPILVPAALGVAVAVGAVLASGALGVAGMCSMRRAVECMRGEVPEARRRVAEAAAYAGEKTEEAGRTVERKAHESGGKASK